MEGALSTSSAAKIIGKSPHWLYLNAERLGIPRYRIGGRWVYIEEEVQGWFRSQKSINDENLHVPKHSRPRREMRVNF